MSHENVVNSALKRANDGATVLRVYQAAGTLSQGVNIRFTRNVSDVREANLIEETGAPVAAGADQFSFDLKPFEISTCNSLVCAELA